MFELRSSALVRLVKFAPPRPWYQAETLVTVLRESWGAAGDRRGPGPLPGVACPLTDTAVVDRDLVMLLQVTAIATRSIGWPDKLVTQAWKRGK